MATTYASLKSELNNLGIKTYRNKTTGERFVKKKDVKAALKVLASNPKGDWVADHPPIPDYQVFNGEYKGEFLTVMVRTDRGVTK